MAGPLNTGGGKLSLLGALSGIAAIIGFVADVGGVRQMVCSPEAFEKVCLKYGLSRPEPAKDKPAPKQELVSKLDGVWGPPGCRKTLRIVTGLAANGETVVTMSDAETRSSGEVIVAADNFILTRVLGGAGGSDDRLEYRLQGSELVLRQDRTQTELVKCG